jgi:hypothetical protein
MSTPNACVEHIHVPEDEASNMVDVITVGHILNI